MIRPARGLAVMLALGLLTAAFRATAIVNTTTVALSFLLIVLAVAAHWGLTESIVASLAATLFFNYFFLPPIGSWTIADPENWVALITFLIVSVVASQLAERARRTAREAIEQQQETERLYSLSRMILMVSGSPEQVAGEVSRLIHRMFVSPGVVLYHRESGKIFRAGEQPIPITDDRLKELVLQGRVVEDSAQRFLALPVSLGGKPLGSLAILGAALSDGARQAVANLVGIALESANSRDLAGRAELMRQSGEFKATLLDALAHDLKTPLTSLKAALGALNDSTRPPANRGELLTVAEEETDRLERLVTEVLRMARLEAGKLRLNRQDCPVGVLIQNAVQETQPLLQGRAVEVRVAPDTPSLSVDVDLIQSALRCLLDNAAKYSAPGKPIGIAAEPRNNEVCISVADQGPGLDEEELSRVFEKYYRGALAHAAIPGTGMGLTIAREIVVAHGGRMWGESYPGQGSRFSLSLPAAGARVGK